MLIVDDESSVLPARKRVLYKSRYEIRTAGSAREGLDILASHAVQVILCDQRMPEVTHRHGRQ